MKRIICVVLLLFGWQVLASAQDETPKAVTVQNRTGDLPFSQTVGTGVEHVDIGSGNVIVDVPIISLPGRHMPFSYGLRYNALFWTVQSRAIPGGQINRWAIEKRPYVGGVNHGLGFTPTQPQLSWSVSTETCTNVYGTDQDVKYTASGYLYTDAGGGKHTLPILQMIVSPDFGCFGTPVSQLQGFAPAEAILARAPDIYSTPAVYMPDGMQVAWPTDNSLLLPPPTPDAWAPINLGQYLDADGNNKCEDPTGTGCAPEADTLGRSPLTLVNNGANQILYQVNDSNGAQQTYTVNLGSITVATSFNIPSTMGAVSEMPSQSRTVVSSIVLPNQTSYSFQYENGSYGGLTSVTLPTGATISYTWATLSPPGNPWATHRYIASRTVTVGSQSSTWTFSKSCADTYCFIVNTDVGDPAGKHTLYQHAQGKVVSAQVYDGAVGSTLLREFDVAYNLSTADPNALPIRTTTKLENGLQTKTEYDYDTTGSVPGNVSEVREYAYGSSAPGALLRRTHKTYGLNTNSSYLAANIVGKVTQESVYDSTANSCQGVAAPCSQAQYEYDNYVVGDNPLQSTSGAAQHDYSGHGASFTLRGNATRVERWRNTDGAWFTTTYSYDDLGNIRAIKDPLGHITSYDYTDSFANSDCLPPAGTNGQAWVSTLTNALGQHVAVTRYPCTGLVQAHKDQNDINAGRSGITYTYDAMGRVLTKSLADGGQTSSAYNDVPPVSVTNTTKINSALNLISTNIVDGLGRTTQTQLNSDPAGVDYTDTTYDVLGRVATVSNPYRSTTEPTYGITQTQYDALGRATQVTKQDGSVSTVSYSGNCTTATDEAGKARKSCSDALGRLIEVDEPGGGTSGTTASGGLTISGTLQTKPATSAVPGTGSVTVAGNEQSKTGSSATSGSVSITITGTELHYTTDPCANPDLPPDQQSSCPQTVYDMGTLTLTVNGHNDQVTYGEGDNTITVASGLAYAVNNDAAASVRASANGSVVTLTSKPTGAGSNFSFSTSAASTDPMDFGAGSFAASPASGSLTGGQNAGPQVYDHGTCTVTINGTPYPRNYNQGDTPSTIASGLASAISGGSWANATASGGTISLTAKTGGAATNYSLTSSTTCSYDSSNFSSPSFSTSTSGATLTGGLNGSPAATDAGTVQISVGGYTGTANYGNGTNQDATASAVASDLVAKIQAQLPASSPSFTISASGASININWGSVGAAGNVTVSTTSNTTQSTYFAKPSFASCTITTNPQSCSTALSGGADPIPPSLSTPWVTLYQYDTLGNLLRADQKGSAANDNTQWRTRLFTFNSLSQMLTAYNPESGTSTYTYDADGELLMKTSPAPNQTGSATQTISFCYDALHRPTKRDYFPHSYSPPACPITAPVVSYVYDSGTNNIGHLTHLNDQAGSADYTYDAVGRVATETRVIAGVSKGMSYEYYLNGSTKVLHYPSGAAVTYTPDSAGHMLSAVDSGNNINYVTGAAYSPSGAATGFVSGQSPSFAGINNTFAYNKRLQACRVAASTTGAVPVDCFAGWGNVLDLGYDFHLGNGDNGNVYAIVRYGDQTRNRTFSYDALNRLTSAQNAGTDCSVTVLGGKTKFWGDNYTYDAWGNLLHKTVTKCSAENLNVTVAANNQLQSGYTYDAAGNMTHDATANLNYSYDQENRISGTNGYTYTYDADSNRLEKSNGSTGTLYWYMAPGVVAESDLSGALKSEYVFFDGKRTARRDFPGLAVSYYFSDHLKSASVITDAVGNVKSDYDYYPWGGEVQFLNNDSNHYKFTDKERDGETGLDYFGARYYSNALGRFATPDPAMKSARPANPQTWNRYTYVLDNPVRLVDPLGLWDFDTSQKGRLLVKQSKEGDDYASLAKQLGLKGKAADKLVAQLEKKFGAGGDHLQLSKMGGSIGSTFQAAEGRLAEQVKYDAKGDGKTPGPSNITNGDCSETAMRIASPQLMSGKNSTNWGGIGEADAMLLNPDNHFIKVAPGNELTGDVFHWDGGGKTEREHFANFLMYSDAGQPQVFSRSGENGKFEIGPVEHFSGYGKVDAIYHPD